MLKTTLLNFQPESLKIPKKDLFLLLLFFMSFQNSECILLKFRSSIDKLLFTNILLPLFWRKFMLKSLQFVIKLSLLSRRSYIIIPKRPPNKTQKSKKSQWLKNTKISPNSEKNVLYEYWPFIEQERSITFKNLHFLILRRQ